MEVKTTLPTKDGEAVKVTLEVPGLESPRALAALLEAVQGAIASVQFREVIGQDDWGTPIARAL